MALGMEIDLGPVHIVLGATRQNVSRVKTRCSRGYRSLGAKISGEWSSLGNIILFFFTKLDTFCYLTV